MPNEFKLINVTKEEACRAAEAEAIRAKTGGTTPLAYDFENDKGFAEEIANIPQTGIIPSGSFEITENGTYDVTEKAEAVVNVSGENLDWFKNITEIHIGKILTEETAYDIDLSSCTSLSTMGSFMNSGNNKVSSVTLKMPPNWVGAWTDAFYGGSSNSEYDLLTEITIDIPVKPRAATMIYGIFGRGSIKTINAVVDFSNVSTSIYFSSTSYQNPFYKSLNLETVSFAPNCINANWKFDWSAVLKDATLVSMANALVAVPHTLTLHETPKSRLSTIMGTVVNDIFTTDESGTVTLENFITQTKGWTIA